MSGKDPIPNPQAYQGVEAVNPPEMIISTRDPTANDKKVRLGSFWLNKSSNTLFVLTSVTAGVTQFSKITSTLV